MKYVCSFETLKQNWGIIIWKFRWWIWCRCCPEVFQCLQQWVTVFCIIVWQEYVRLITWLNWLYIVHWYLARRHYQRLFQVPRRKCQSEPLRLVFGIKDHRNLQIITFIVKCLCFALKVLSKVLLCHEMHSFSDSKKSFAAKNRCFDHEEFSTYSWSQFSTLYFTINSCLAIENICCWVSKEQRVINCVLVWDVHDNNQARCWKQNTTTYTKVPTRFH